MFFCDKWHVNKTEYIYIHIDIPNTHVHKIIHLCNHETLKSNNFLPGSLVLIHLSQSHWCFLAISSALPLSTLAIALHITLHVGRGCSGLSRFNHAAINSEYLLLTSLSLALIILTVFFEISRWLAISSHWAAQNGLHSVYTLLKSPIPIE